jgi:hypothetical protein
MTSQETPKEVFIQKQLEINLMEAQISLIKASYFSLDHSATYDDIGRAIRSIQDALDRKER